MVRENVIQKEDSLRAQMVCLDWPHGHICLAVLGCFKKGKVQTKKVVILVRPFLLE